LIYRGRVARYQIVPEQARVWIEAQSSLHPIHTETTGLEGWLDIDVSDASGVSLAAPVGGYLELRVERLRSGNPLEDRELRRRIDARRYPVVSGKLTDLRAADGDGAYVVRGDLTFMGATRTYEHVMSVVTVDARTIRLTGGSTFDIRDFGMEPPRILMLKVHPEVAVRVDIEAQRSD
jgi:polyisoprenoid-binding protein YceI